MFAFAPDVIAHADYESTMGLVQKMIVLSRAGRHGDVHFGGHLRRRERACTCARQALPPIGWPIAAAELTAVFGAIVLVTGPLWAAKPGASGGTGKRGCRRRASAG